MMKGSKVEPLAAGIEFKFYFTIANGSSERKQESQVEAQNRSRLSAAGIPGTQEHRMR